MGRVINWIMREHNKIIEIYKEFLPKKAKRTHLPHIVWIQLPLHNSFHNNDMHEKFNTSLITVAKMHDNVSVLVLKKVWDPQDTKLYVKEADRFTNKGLKTYWEAIDRMLKFCDTTILKRIAKLEIKESPFNVDKHQGRNRIAKVNPFKWRRSDWK